MTSKMRNEITRLETLNTELMEEVKVLQENIEKQQEHMAEFPDQYDDELEGLDEMEQPSIIENEERSSDGS